MTASDPDDLQAGSDRGGDHPEGLEASPSSDGKPERLTVEGRAHGWRLDHYLSRLYPNHSRARIQKAIDSGAVTLNGLEARSSRRLRVNDRIDFQLPDADEPRIQPEDIPLELLYEDEHFVVVNKPAQMVVHPGRGSYSGTMTAALQYRFDTLSDVAGRHRPGIVHRLDRDTTGVIVVARNNQVHQQLSRQFEERTVQKEYAALVYGVPEFRNDIIRTHVRVHSRIREKMMVCPPGGKAREAVTRYEVQETFGPFALMRLHPKTGRTHQLRVHMLYTGTPILADAMYSGHTIFTTAELPNADPHRKDPQVLIRRQALHARRLNIRHPVTEQSMEFVAPFPDDFRTTLEALRGSVPD